jgi:hypothetical protein
MTENDGFEVLSEAEIAREFPSALPRRNAMEEIDQLRASVRRLNEWLAYVDGQLKQLKAAARTAGWEI